MRLPQNWRSDLVTYGRKIGPTIGIFISVGILVAAWAAAGVTGLLVVSGLELISPQWFLVSAAVITGIISFATGTSWGTVSTIGIALMGVAHGLGLNPAAAAGAIIAGSLFGDKLSPLSETTTLAATMTGTDLYTHIRHTMLTTVPAFLIGLGVYVALGLAAAPSPDLAAAQQLQATIAAHFDLHGSLWAPVGVVLAAALFRWPVIPSLLGSALLSLVLALTVQAYPAAELPGLLWQGYRPSTGDAAVDALLTQGGIWAMGRLAFAAAGLFAVVVLLIKSRPGQRLLMRVTALATTRFRAVALAVGISLAIMFASGATYLAILVTAELMRASFERLGLAPENLSRTLEDSGTVISPLVPWGVSGLFMAGTLGVSTWAYAPYTVMSYLGFSLALLYGYTGWFITSRPTAVQADGGLAAAAD